MVDGLFLEVAAEPVATIVDNGDPANRIDLVILGDGYTASQLGQYATNAQTVVNGIFGQEPFREYELYFNVHRVDVISNESGAGYFPNVVRDTAFDSHFNCQGIGERALCTNEGKVLTVLSSSVLPNEMDLVIVLVNSTIYGGSGGFVASISRHSATVNIALHELGHSFGDLLDEYGPEGGGVCNNSVEPAADNLTRETNRSLIKWGYWIDPVTPIPTTTTQNGVPGLYQGGGNCAVGLYRPTLNSKMKTAARPFEQINQEHLVKRFYSYVSPIDRALPEPGYLRTSDRRSITLQVVPMHPRSASHDLDLQWSVEGGTQSSTAEQFLVSWPAFPRGTFTVHADVSDDTIVGTTAWVRSDPSALLTERASWDVEIVCAGDCVDDGFEPDVTDIVRSVNVVLGSSPLSSCDRADVNGDSQVFANELAEVAQNALCGCGITEPAGSCSQPSAPSLTGTEIQIGSIPAAAGYTVQVPISLFGGGSWATALQFDLVIDPSRLTVPNGDDACALHQDLSEFAVRTRLVSPDKLRVVVADLDLDSFRGTIRDGVVMYCSLTPVPGTSGVTTVSGERYQLVGLDLEPMEVGLVPGEMSVQSCTGCGCPGAMAVAGGGGSEGGTEGSFVVAGAELQQLATSGRAGGSVSPVDLRQLSSLALVGGGVYLEGGTAMIPDEDVVIRWRKERDSVVGQLLRLDGSVLAEFRGRMDMTGASGQLETTAGRSTVWRWSANEADE